MWRVVLAVVLLAPLAMAQPTRPGRELLQSAVSCSAQIPACMPRRCATRILESKETYTCLRCMNGYAPVKGADGKSIVQCGE